MALSRLSFGEARERTCGVLRKLHTVLVLELACLIDIYLLPL